MVEIMAETHSCASVRTVVITKPCAAADSPLYREQLQPDEDARPHESGYFFFKLSM
jgi:hypothetical protein